MEFLYFLEGLRNDVFDALFSIITLFGEETMFLAVGLIIFWCVDKYQGYFVLCTGFLGTVINQFLKMLFRIPRPWIKDSSFTIVDSAKEGAFGYSFPSGHTQVSVGLYGAVAIRNKAKPIRICALALCLLVPFSRLYLGVHTPLDVCVSVAIAVLIVIFGSHVFKKAENSPKIMYCTLFTLAFITMAYLIFVCFTSFPSSVYTNENINNLVTAKETAFTLLGCIIGLIVVFTVDNKYLNFKTTGVWWVQIIKAVGGLAIVLSVKELLKFPLDYLFDESLVARTLRYFCVVITAGILWPMTFKYFSKLAQRKKGLS